MILMHAFSAPMRNAVRRFSIILFLTAPIGCGNSSPTTKEVRGLVTFQGGPPPKAGKITLAPVEVPQGLPRRPASGNFNESGIFTLTTFKPEDGVIPGRYTANILCWREQPTLETRHSANFVPPDFQPELTIEADAKEPVELRIDVPTIQNGKK